MKPIDTQQHIKERVYSCNSITTHNIKGLRIYRRLKDLLKFSLSNIINKKTLKETVERIVLS